MKYFVFYILVAFCLSLIALPVHAITMKNDNYILQLGTFTTAAGKPTGSGVKLGITVGQTAPGLFTGTNYKVRSGFQYVHSIIPFTFTISETLIDFGTLSPTNPITRTNDLAISNGSANGYSVTAIENHELMDQTQGVRIPDTTCDTGTCSETLSGPWANTLTYGFGYRCDNLSGTDCQTGFTDSAYFKQFTDNSKSESAQSVMKGANVGRNKKVKITYKVNISGTQEAGNYENVVTYIATPTF